MRRSPLLAAAMLSTVLLGTSLLAGLPAVGAAAGSPAGGSLPARLPQPDVATVPSGFTDNLVTNGTSTPVAVTALPDGRALVLQKAGQVRVVQNGALLATVALSLTTGPNVMCSNSERGLLGVAPDPDFASNGYLFLYYTRTVTGGCVNRVSRFTMVGSTIARNTEVVLLDNIGSPAGNHNGGDVAIGNDGFLYVSIGDGGCDPRNDSGCDGGNNAAQDLSLLNGKILRVNRASGLAAPGNPFSGAGTADCRVRGNSPSTPTTICREIFAYGLRNPWRFAFDPNTGATKFFINDVGQNAREEVNVGVLGANYGWPAREGLCAQVAQTPCLPPADSLGYTQPLTDYSHNDANTDFGGEYITGGAFIPNGAWSSANDGGYLYADGDPGRIFLRPAVPPVMPTSVYSNPFALNVKSISDIEFVMEPSGWALYYVLPSFNEVRKIVFTTAPAASPGNLAYAPVSPQRVFDSRGLGAASGPLRAGTSRLVNVTPTQGGHRAALVNLTMVRPGAAGYLAAWRPRTTRPPSSNLNGEAGQVTANSSIVPIDADGNVLLFVNVGTHVVVDVLGYFDVTTAGSAKAGRLVPVDAHRVADTRDPSDGDSNNYTRTIDGIDNVVSVPLANLWGLPPTATAVALIVTGIASPDPGSGFVVALPHGGVVPTTSNLNTNGSNDVRANLVVVPLGADGSIDLRLRNTEHVLIDVVGSFTDAAAPNLPDGTFVMVTPTRVVDTRFALGFTRLSAGGSAAIDPTVVPGSALAVAQNLVITAPARAGFLASYATGLPSVPTVSNTNATGPGQVRSAMALTAMGGGSVSYFSSMATELVVDVTGYFAGLTS